MGIKAYPRTAEKILISALREWKMAVRYTFERLKSHSAKDPQRYSDLALREICLLCALQHLHELWVRC